MREPLGGATYIHSPMLITTLVLSAVALAVSLVADGPRRTTAGRVAGGVLRVVLVMALAVMLYWDVGAGVGRAWRRAIVTSDRITSAPPAFPTYTEYASGVSTMRREMEEETPLMLPFLIPLMILAITPAFQRRQRASSQSAHGTESAV